MNASLDQTLDGFLRQYCVDSPPMLLGLSGGADSMALFYHLLHRHYPFEAAYLDHGWRKVSQKEARSLADLCHGKGIPFHTMRMQPSLNIKNQEERGREARLAFFKTIIEERGLKGVFLAHHADDQAETVLKRIFEGATLPKLRGLTPEKQLSGILILRPFLKVKKKSILKWLSEKNIFFFEDSTNQDPQFLRTRLRHQLLPTLSATFGKEVAAGLCKMGESAFELHQFLDEMIQPYLSQIQELERGITIDFSQGRPPHPYLWKMVIRQLFRQYNIGISEASVNAIFSHLYKGSCHKSLQIGRHSITLHKRQIIIKKFIIKTIS